jgi:murein L,D-transpeptidase YcbB/YkuD
MTCIKMCRAAYQSVSFFVAIGLAQGWAGANLAFAEPDEQDFIGLKPALSSQIVVQGQEANPVSFAPLATLSPYAQSLKQALEREETTLSKKRDDQRDHAALMAFYKERGYEPLFYQAGERTKVTEASLTYLNSMDSHGLNPSDYSVPEKVLPGAFLLPMTAAEAELDMAHAILRFARDAYSGRISPSSISSTITLKRHVPDPVALLQDMSKLAGQDSKTGAPVSNLLDGLHPPHKDYWALHTALQKIREEQKDKPSFTTIPEGRMLRPGHTDKRVALLRERLNIQPPADRNLENIYDETLVESVKQFQKEHKLTQDGVVGPATLARLNHSLEPTEADVLANMEQWRWMPRDLGEFHVFVNIPQFRLHLMNKGQMVHTTRVVVGKAKHKTPVFSDEIEHIVVNPFWNVPASIATKELLPRIKSDPGYLVRSNYDVVKRIGGRARVVDPYSVDWSNVSYRTMPRLRQRPGRRNALGTIKFMFPNDHAVYLHDTPSKSLFQKDYRAFSHGCVRVHEPMAFADALLAFEKDWSGHRLQKMIGGRESTILLKQHIPVHLAYFTLSFDEEGQLHRYQDVYGHHARLKAALGL